MREMMPKVTSSRLVKMKALMALVSFWIFLLRFGGPGRLPREMLPVIKNASNVFLYIKNECTHGKTLSNQ